MIELTEKVLIDILDDLGCTVKHGETTDYNYKRLFITRCDGVQIGRITLYNGKYRYVKWYNCGSANVSNKFSKHINEILESNELQRKIELDCESVQEIIKSLKNFLKEDADKLEQNKSLFERFKLKISSYIDKLFNFVTQ